jgi:aminopeptidase N
MITLRNGLAWSIVFAAAMGAISRKDLGAERRETLPESVVPVRYELLIRPNAEALTFEGSVSILLEVKAASREIVLNSEELVFDGVSLDSKFPGKAETDKEAARGRATIRFETPVSVGRHTLKIDYHGKIGQTTAGFFAMDYQTPKGPRRTLATNFEPASARRFLPCWDEPGRKAEFSIVVDAPSDRMALSNMPIAESRAISPKVNRIRFETTPRMSTYLLYLGIGDYERAHKEVRGTDVGVVVKRGDLGKASYGLEQAGRLLEYYNDYFGVKYPLPKLDLIAAPGQIRGGSMENWGAIFYSQNHLLFDPQSSTEADRQLAFLVISHEMAHQWFGNLVTMAWWDHLWLNEGFARWMQTHAADALHPEWETGLRAQSIFEAGKSADALPSTHPILQTVLTPEQAMQAFDQITYDKGAAIITMLHEYIGPEKFRKGIQRYMREHAFGNTVDKDLWGIMEEVAGKPILEIEHDFTRQEGVPLARLRKTSRGMEVSEGRFLSEGPARTAQTVSWTMPLRIKPEGGPERTFLLRGGTNVAANYPLLVNAGQQAYARVLYPPEGLAALLPMIPRLAAVDQLGLLHDARALGFAGYEPSTNLLAIIERVPGDANPLVWQAVAGLLEELDRHYADSPKRAAFRQYARNLLAPVESRLEGNAGNLPPNAEVLRSELELALGKWGETGLVARAQKTLAEGTGSAGEQRTALQICAARANQAEFERLLERARKELDPLAKLHIYEALAGVEESAPAEQMAGIAMSAEVPAGSNGRLLAGLASLHPDLAWKVVVTKLGESQRIDKIEQWQIAAIIAANSAKPARIEELRAYVEKSVPEEARRPFKGSEAAIRQNAKIAKEALPQINEWIAKRL